ncbi:MAG: SDR family NAD(P)-dependent oxidoreductase [Candidatus Thorarchaeota archaeon]
MSIKDKKIVVTGAAGFIGSNLVDKFLELGVEVIGVDNLYNGRMENLEDALKSKKFEFIKGDIRDLNFLLDIFQDIDIIYHEAAFTSVPESLKLPATCNDFNLNGTLNILNAARQRDIEKIIFASSASVYGDIDLLPIKEDIHRMPISPYGASKLACEAYMQSYHFVYGLETVCLRYFNVYGPKQGYSPYSGVISIWLSSIMRNEDLIVFGDGENLRDYTYIKDVVQANLIVANKDIGGEILNIACGSPINLTDLAKLMLKLTNKDNLKIIYTDPRLGDIKHSYGDTSKAKRLIDFESNYNQEEGLRDYIKWYFQKYKINM